MNWIYPEEGKVWEEGEEIVAEFEHCGDISVCKLKRFGSKWRRVNGAMASTVQYDKPNIIAYMPYTKPEPPEKPQDCPFCGGSVTLYSGDVTRFHWYLCDDGLGCGFRIGKQRTKAEAIKALNSVRVEL